MKFCTKCGCQLNDTDAFCTSCGAPFEGDTAPQTIPAPEVTAAPQQDANAPQQPPVQPQQPVYQQPVQPQQPPMYQQPMYAQPVYDPNDHTAEFTVEDISANKVTAMAAYLLGTLGCIIALLAAHESPFAGFHVREALKITFTSILGSIAFAILFVLALFVSIASMSTGFLSFITFLYSIFAIIVLVVRVICFFRVCKGQAKTAPIVGNLPFLK
jgi:uncharacterized membrane protein